MISGVGDLRQGVRRAASSPLVYRATTIYETANRGVWFQLHGSLDSWEILDHLGIGKELDAEARANDAASACTGTARRELEQLMVEKGLSGSVIFSPAGWRQTEMGRSLARHPLINYARQDQCPPLAPPPLPAQMETSGLFTASKSSSWSALSPARPPGPRWRLWAPRSSGSTRPSPKTTRRRSPSSLMAGKTTVDLDLEDPTDRERLTSLYEQADVVIQGYRLGSLERRGFGLQAALHIANKRGKGVVFVDENCYGPDGYYAERPGWQQVADAAAGSSYVMGQAFGCPPGQGVLPSLPISDMATGILTSLTAVCGLRDRAKFGGSYHGHASLTA
ncbi:uncharacterized protein PG986_008705 [Apiospora aurea]|uniref:Uncharacterized protein n=1 Tax=Apiospora aurea TaxID=335848 RepID=A0ABR1Q617_9PEZI